ncbi:DUF438 domain-containing protein [Mariniphaga sp.]|uniref:DUF438 domain-containing protein n=1 Tax=Mariniphaga sp. TaxID=1954475 RepID=UPI00356AD502
MSEFINNSEKRLDDLLAVSLGIMNGENGKELIEKYKDAIEHITPFDMLKLEDRQMQMGIGPELIKVYIDKVINIFFKYLKNYPWEKPGEGTFLYYLLLENSALTFKLNQIKKIIKSYKGRENDDFKEMQEKLLPNFRELFGFESHYLKKENILFPFLEKNWNDYRPLKVMWSIHDDIRKTLKNLVQLLENSKTQWEDFTRVLGKYFFLAFGMIQKEELVLYPIASETIKKEEWEEMHIQSFEYHFPFIESPEKPKTKKNNSTKKFSTPDANEISGIWSETGFMDVEQALLVFNSLPVEITLVDENDTVKFFNRGKDRIFPRSAAIIGRSVQNCHPPESIHVVEEIVKAFRAGKKEKAEFWIQMKDKFILIQYFALRNKNGEYKGVLEVSQDVTEIRNLKGEKRLLDWE